MVRLLFPVPHRECRLLLDLYVPLLSLVSPNGRSEEPQAISTERKPIADD
jgi:hypothetical protein